MNRIIFLVAIMLAVISPDKAAAQTWGWNTGGEGTTDAVGNDVVTDSAGNIYVCGSFGNFFGGSFSLEGEEIQSAGNRDGYVAKYSAAHRLQWLKRMGGTDEDGASAIGVDGLGHVYVGGSFTGTAVFGLDTLFSVGMKDVFLVKYDSMGNEIWAKRAGSIYNDYFNHDFNGKGLVVRANGDFYITGIFSSIAASPPLKAQADFGDKQIMSLGNGDIFVAKYDSSGNPIWVKDAGGVDSDGSTDIDVDRFGNTFISGDFSSNSIFVDSIQLTSVSSGNITGNIFLAKYDSTGKALWARTAGGISSGVSSGGSADGARSIAVDVAGNTYITGAYGECQLKIGNIRLPYWAGYDIFLAKYDPSGNLLWAKRAGGYSQDIGLGLALDKEGYPYLTGAVGNPAYFGSDSLIGPNPVGSDIFVSKWDKNGEVLWATSAGGTGYDQANSIYVSDGGHIYITGYYSSAQVLFGGNPLTNTGGKDMFVAELLPPAAGIAGSPHANPMSVYPNPSAGDFTVRLNGARASHLSVIDLLGREVYSRPVPAGTQVLPVSLPPLANGIYNLLLMGEGGRISHRLSLRH